MGIVALQLDKLKTVKSVRTYSDLARLLAVERQTISQWRSGATYPDEERIAQMAEMAGEHPGTWLIQVREERATGKARKGYAEALRQLGAAVVLVIAALPALPAHASSSSSSSSAERVPAIGIMRTVRIWLRSAFERFALRWARGNGSPAVLA